MKNFLNLSFVCIATLFLMGCPDNDPYPASLGPISSSFFTEFIIPLQINGESRIYSGTANPYDGSIENFWMTIDQISGTSIRLDGRNWDGFYEESIYQQFQAIATLIGDTSFNKPVTYADGIGFLDTIQSIHFFVSPGFYSDEDKESIDSVTKISYYLPYEFVKSGYESGGRSEVYEDKLSDFNGDFKIFLEPSFAFELMKAPAKSDTFQFTTVVKFTNGKEFEIPSDPIYVKGVGGE